MKKIIFFATFFALTLNSAYANTMSFTPSDTFNDVWVTLDADLDMKMLSASGKEVYSVDYCINWGAFKHCDKFGAMERFNPSKRYIIRFAKKKRDRHLITVTTKLGTVVSISEESPSLRTRGEVRYNY